MSLGEMNNKFLKLEQSQGEMNSKFEKLEKSVEETKAMINMSWVGLLPIYVSLFFTLANSLAKS
jgi:hypothetical protein